MNIFKRYAEARRHLEEAQKREALVKELVVEEMVRRKKKVVVSAVGTFKRIRYVRYEYTKQLQEAEEKIREGMKWMRRGEVLSGIAKKMERLTFIFKEAKRGRKS